jgi:hypothetical protein
MHPAWSRWLPCSIHLLRVVPDPYRFPRKALDDLPEEFAWDEPAWCDPGDPDELIAAAVADNDGGDEQWAAAHAREHYDERVKLRANRIDAFTNMCRRAGVAPPATLAQLLECLIGLGLYHGETVDGEEWLLPRLWQNPIDVLPLGFEELAEEISNQFHERALLAGAGLRRLALETLRVRLGDSLAECAARWRLRAISTFEHLTEEELEAGFAALGAAVAAETTPQPVYGSGDLLVLGPDSSWAQRIRPRWE